MTPPNPGPTNYQQTPGLLFASSRCFWFTDTLKLDRKYKNPKQKKGMWERLFYLFRNILYFDEKKMWQLAHLELQKGKRTRQPLKKDIFNRIISDD